jgi:hypothetical protein
MVRCQHLASGEPDTHALGGLRLVLLLEGFGPHCNYGFSISSED